MMSNRFFVVSLIVIGLIVTCFTFAVNPEIFGDTVENGNSINIENQISGGYFQMGATSGLGDSITAFVSETGLGTCTAKCGLYESDKTLVTNGITNTNEIDGTNNWVTFTFAVSPVLNASAYYYVVVWSEERGGSTTATLNYEADVGSGGVYYDSETFNGFPSVFSGDIEDDDGSASIYCTYTESAPPVNNAPSLQNESPSNGLTGLQILPELYAMCNDSDDDTMNATWLSNSSGSWVQFAYNNSISENDNITQTNNNFSDYSTKYYWSVNLSDGMGGYANETYNFTTMSAPESFLIYEGLNIQANYPNSRRLVRCSNGNLYIAFEVDGKTYIAYSENDGLTWKNKSVSALAGINPVLTVDSTDIVHLVYSGYAFDPDDRQLEYANSTTDFNTVVQLIDDDKHYSLPSIAVDSNDKLHLVFVKGEEGASNDDQIGYINSTDYGHTWSDEQILTDEQHSGDDTWLPTIAVNTTDSLHLVFSCERGFANEYMDIRHMESNDGGSTWTNWEGDIVIQTNNNLYYHAFVIDENDTLHISYTDLTSLAINHTANKTSWDTWNNEEDIIFENSYTSALSIDSENDYIYSVVVSQSDDDLYYNYNTSDVWQMATKIIDEYTLINFLHIGLVYSLFPVVDSVRTNIPTIGYASYYVNDSYSLKYYPSSNLEWGTPIIADEELPTQTFNQTYNYSVWWTIDISDNSGMFNYTIECNNSDIKFENSVSNGTFEILLYNLTTSCEYAIYVNVTDGDNWQNDTYTYTFIGGGTGECDYSEGEMEKRGFLLIQGLSLENETIGLVLFFALWFWAERKEDFVYFILASVLGLPMSVYLLYNTTSMFDTFLGVGVMLLSVYTSFLALVYSVKGRK